MKTRGIIYCRVSSQDQVKGTSLASQKIACLEYAERNGISVDRVFIEEGESATAANRTELTKALAYCCEHKDKINYFIVFKLDRFSRNMIDHYALQAQLLKYGTVLYSVMEPMIGIGATGKAMEGMLATFAQFENDVRKMRCEGGMQRKIIEGIWPWQPPIGYIHGKKLSDRRKNSPDEIDPERFYLIQRGLKAFARGEHTITTLTGAFQEWGLKTRTGRPIYKQLVEKMLRDKYYSGILINPWTSEGHQGLHQPAISPEEHNQIQFYKSGLSNNATKPRLKLNPDFVLRGLVSCTCGGKYTGSWQSGRSKRYSYYRCNTRGCQNYNRNISRDKLEEIFVAFLKKISPTNDFLNIFETAVIEVWKKEHDNSQRLNTVYEKELNSLLNKKQRLLDLRIGGEISKEEFSRLKDELDNKITGVQISSNETKLDGYDMETAITYATKFMRNISRQWQDMDPKQKQRFQRLVLPKGIIFDRKTETIGTAVLSPVFTLSQAYSGNGSDLVAGPGFEPGTQGYEPCKMPFLHPAI